MEKSFQFSFLVSHGNTLPWSFYVLPHEDIFRAQAKAQGVS
jgi:hypothetical protein